MKLLLITDEVWNDRLHGNNVLTNWLSGFDGEIAHIYCAPGLPNNPSKGTKYFRFTDGGMLKSLLKRGYRDGMCVTELEEEETQVAGTTDVTNIGFLRKHMGNTLRLFKSVVWRLGKYNTKELEKFVTEFAPDIIFAPRFATTKMLRLERTVQDIAGCPMVAFTGDNEYSLRKFSFSPIFWLNELILRRSLRKMMPRYSMYYTLSYEQKEEYENRFGIRAEVIHKCGDVPTETEKIVNDPIRIVYAGKLYCGRWKTLAAIGKSLNKINVDGVKMVLDIYTKDAVSNKQKNLLDDGKSIFLRGAAKPEDIPEIYKSSDIALHVESFDLKHRLATRVSFSTKIIDCLASSCAVMAIAWREHSGLTYLEREDAAICISSMGKLETELKKIAENPDKIDEYRKKASACMARNHQRAEVQKKLYQSFEDIISNQ